MTNPLLKTVLTREAMRIQGIDEAPLPVMQLAAFRKYIADDSAGFMASDDKRLHQRLMSRAARAKRQLQGRPVWQAYYQQFNMMRAMGGDPLSIPVPSQRAKPLGQASTPTHTAQSEAERYQWCLKQPVPRPQAHRCGDRSKEAQEERRELWALRDEILAAQKRHAAELRSAEKAADRLTLMAIKAKDPALRPVRCANALSARGALRRLQSWGARALEDLAIIERLGRAVPVADRHLLATVPVHMRPHHPVGD